MEYIKPKRTRKPRKPKKKEDPVIENILNESVDIKGNPVIKLRIVESMTGMYRIADKVGGSITVDYKLAKKMIRDGYAVEI